MSRAAPIADTVIAGASLIGGAAYVTVAATTKDHELAQPVATITGATLLAYAMIFSAAAVYGYRTVDACRAEQAARAFASR